MANPSLQIGNGKFAIKENDLLGYSSSGTRFFPIPITMTRATLGSRVNPSGLIEDVELLGSEEVNCGSFDCADPNAAWSTGTGWTISSGKAVCDGSQTGNTSLQQSGVADSGKVYKIQFDLTVDAGFINYVNLGGWIDNTNLTTSDTYTYYTSTTTNTDNLGIAGDSNFVGSIDNISVKEATIDGLARVDYTDGTASLLVEPQRTNLITYSEDFSQSYWAKQSGVIPTYNTTETLSPDGTYNATKFIGTGFKGVFKSSISVSGNITRSVYLKSVSGTTTAVFKDPNATGSATPVNLTITNEWQRFELIGDNGTSSQGLWIDDITSDGLYMWGAQVEQGSYPTSYIKTQGSSVTRNKDQYTKTGISDKINSEEGVFFVEIAALSDDGTNRIITLSDGSYNNSIRIAYYTNTNEIEIRLVVGGVIQVLSRVNIGNVLIFNKIAFKYKVNDFALWVNGTEIYSLSSGSTYASETLNRLAFDDTTGFEFFGKVRQLQVYKTALSDSELATLTT